MPDSPAEQRATYARIPGGRHGLAPDLVSADQRARLHAAMVQVVAERGYVAATVEDLISRAGVSRRTFYENYENKQGCLIAACDVVLAEWRREGLRAYQAAVADGRREIGSRIRAGLEALFDLVLSDPLGARALFVEMLNCGSAGVEHLESALGEIEDALRRTFEESDGPLPLPPSMIKVIVGGVLEIITLRLRRDRTSELPALVNDVLGWILCYRSAQAADVVARARWQESMLTGVTDVESPSAREAATDERQNVPFWAVRPITIDHPRARALEATVKLVSRYGYVPLSIRTICEYARLSHNTFRKYFSSSEDAFLEAYRTAAQETITYSLTAYAAQPEWDAAVHAGLTAELRFLAMRPDIARIGFLEVYAAGPQGLRLRDAELHMFTVALDPGHKRRARHLHRVVSELIAGGLYYQWRAFLLHNPPEKLPSLAPVAIYVALTPFIGPDAAAAVAAAPGSA